MSCVKGMLLQIIGFVGVYVRFIQAVIFDVMIIAVAVAFRSYVGVPYILVECPNTYRVSHCVP
jgi:hypothetical protein